MKFDVEKKFTQAFKTDEKMETILDRPLKRWLTSMNNLSFISSKLVRTLLKGFDITDEESELKDCLKWKIFKGGVLMNQTLEDLMTPKKIKKKFLLEKTDLVEEEKEIKEEEEEK